jgi:hypothetical protein
MQMGVDTVHAQAHTHRHWSLQRQLTGSWRAVHLAAGWVLSQLGGAGRWTGRVPGQACIKFTSGGSCKCQCQQRVGPADSPKKENRRTDQTGWREGGVPGAALTKSWARNCRGNSRRARAPSTASAAVLMAPTGKRLEGVTVRKGCSAARLGGPCCCQLIVGSGKYSASAASEETEE